MELNDEIMIAASKTRVYEALNDTEILTACIPGCEELTDIPIPSWKQKLF